MVYDNGETQAWYVSPEPLSRCQQQLCVKPQVIYILSVVESGMKISSLHPGILSSILRRSLQPLYLGQVKRSLSNHISDSSEIYQENLLSCQTLPPK